MKMIYWFWLLFSFRDALAEIDFILCSRFIYIGRCIFFFLFVFRRPPACLLNHTRHGKSSTRSENPLSWLLIRALISTFNILIVFAVRRAMCRTGWRWWQRVANSNRNRNANAHKTIIEKWHEIWNKSHLYDWWPKAQIDFTRICDEHNLFCKTLLHTVSGIIALSACGWFVGCAGYVTANKKIRERKVIRLRNAIAQNKKKKKKQMWI